MNLNCIVQLHDRELRYSTKWQHSVLSLEKKVDSYKIEVHLVWETEEKNQVKYLISTRDLRNHNKNLMGTDSDYTNSSKKYNCNFVMWFKNPLHNLAIKTSDDVSLRTFTQFVWMMSDGWWYSCYKLSFYISSFTLKTTKYDENKSKYPPKEGFLPTTEHLILRTLNITELDPQIFFNLHSLKVLDLSNNQIVFLPKELGTLPHLEKLFLSHNYLGNACSEIAKWEWMEQTAILQSLKELDISNNNLTEMPLQVGNLQNLICLNVSENLLTKVPQIIGTLQQLAWLDVSTNRLTYLPGSMRGMDLCFLYTENNLFKDLRIDEYRSPTLKVVSLLDLAAKAVRKYRIPYNNVPSRLVRYLDNSKYCCICRNPCFDSDIKDFKLLLDRPPLAIIENLNVCHRNVYLSENRKVIFKCYFCSPKCYVYYCNIFN